MILSKNADDINTLFDFSEGIISEIKWDLNRIDLLITVNYNWDAPAGCMDQDLTIRFKNCSNAKFNMQRAVTAMKADGIDTLWQEIDSIHLDRTADSIHVMIDSNFSKKMLELFCQGIEIEKGNDNEVR